MTGSYGSGWSPPPPPGAGGPSAAWQPPAPPAYGSAPGTGRTNPLAIVSLVAGIAQFTCLPIIASIVAIVTGHVARGQIDRSQGREQGRGMALAGLILGYVGVVLTVLAVAGLVTFFAVFADDVERAQLRDDAREYAALALVWSEGSPRDPDALTEAYRRIDEETQSEMALPDGTAIPFATAADWEREGWRVEFEGDFGAHVCLTIPENAATEPVVRNGRCPAPAGSAL